LQPFALLNYLLKAFVDEWSDVLVRLVLTRQIKISKAGKQNVALLV